MVIGQVIKVRRRGMHWSRWRTFIVSAVGYKGILGCWASQPQLEIHISNTSHEWKEIE